MAKIAKRTTEARKQFEGKANLPVAEAGHGDAGVIDKRFQLACGIGQHNAAADVKQRLLGFDQPGDDRSGRFVVDRRLVQLAGVLFDPLEQRDVDFLGEDVHRHVDQHRPGLAALGKLEGLFQYLRHVLRALDPPDPLAEGAIDFALGAVGVQVDLLVRVLAVVVARDVARDDHHRDAVECSVGHAGCSIGQPRAQMTENDRGLFFRPGIAVSSMGSDLLVAGVDEFDRTVFQRRENGDIGVPAEPEDIFDTSVLKVFHQLFCNEIFHCNLRKLSSSSPSG
jgi:hypothetical protein